jgi:hypothetical protein
MLFKMDPHFGSYLGEEGWEMFTRRRRKLIEAVKKHGNMWLAVAKLVPGRTNDRCLQRWAHTVDPALGKNTAKWTPEEDAMLSKAVKKHGKDSWAAPVAAIVSGRTVRQCRYHWVNFLDPNNPEVNTAKWTTEDDTMLAKAVKEHGNDWVAVSKLVPGFRTNTQCRVRWIYAVDSTNGKKDGKWTPDKDYDLRKAVQTHGKDWIAVATMVPS